MKIETVWAALDSLLDYAKNCELLHPLDETFARNSLLAKLKLESYEKQKEHYEFPECLNVLCDYAAEQGQIHDTIAERDLFDTRLMGCVTPRPSEVVRKFWSLYAESPKAATDYFYKLSQDCNYMGAVYSIRQGYNRTGQPRRGQDHLCLAPCRCLHHREDAAEHEAPTAFQCDLSDSGGRFGRYGQAPANGSRRRP